jgi:hypothetical protein
VSASLHRVLLPAIPVAEGWLEALLVLGALLLTAHPTHRVAEPVELSPAGDAPG